MKFKVEETDDDRNPLIWLLLFGIGGAWPGTVSHIFGDRIAIKKQKLLKK